MERFWGGNEDYPGGTLMRGLNESLKGYQPYTGNLVAGLNPFQTGAGNALWTAGMQGTALGNAGREQGRATVEGNYLTGNKANPYAGTDGIGYNLQQGNVEQNQFMGENPYFMSQLDQGTKKITDAYKRGTSADTTRMYNLSGAFGGSAHADAVKNNEEALGEQLGNYTNSMLSGQYDRSANLRESDIGRQWQNSMFNVGEANKNVDRYNQGRDRGFNAYENERGRMTGMVPTAMGNDSQYISNLMAAMGYGDKMQGQTQRELDDQYQRWTEGQNWDRNQINWLADFLGKAQGTTQSVQQFGGYGGINPMAGLLGAGAMYGAFK
jgi:hypothetical protein